MVLFFLGYKNENIRQMNQSMVWVSSLRLSDNRSRLSHRFIHISCEHHFLLLTKTWLNQSRKQFFLFLFLYCGDAISPAVKSQLSEWGAPTEGMLVGSGAGERAKPVQATSIYSLCVCSSVSCSRAVWSRGVAVGPSAVELTSTAAPGSLSRNICYGELAVGFSWTYLTIVKLNLENYKQIFKQF